MVTKANNRGALLATANCYWQFVTLFKENAKRGEEQCPLLANDFRWPCHSSRFYGSYGQIGEESMTVRLGWECYET